MPVRRDLTRCDGVLADDEVHVWHFSLDLPEQAVDPLLAILDAGERDRAARFKIPAPRNQYIASHAFLRAVLGRYLQIDPTGIRFRTSTKGKPELTEGHLRFNLSHTEGTAVVAISRRWTVGVDVEKVRENLEPLELADRFFSRQEAEWIRSQPDARRIPAFFACWTAKEAYIKACGGGLSIPLAGFCVIPYAGQPELNLDVYGKPEDSARWSIWQLDLDASLRSALAVEGEGRDLTVRVGRTNREQLFDLA
ncbi:MAG: 4'-phosphopantetheinyl transferase superfamily protein [Terriglobales bacterium]